jgi:hypothetical protein
MDIRDWLAAFESDRETARIERNREFYDTIMRRVRARGSTVASSAVLAGLQDAE